MTTTNSGTQNASLSLFTAAWLGFVAMTTAFTKQNQESPLKILVEGRDCPVLEVGNDGTARVETATGEETVALTPEHVQSLYQKIGREFDLQIPNFQGEETRASSAGAGAHQSGGGGYSGA